MRYFLVAYVHSTGFGMIDFTCDNCYLNRDLAIKQIIEKSNLESIVIISITELSKKDFKQFKA